MSVSKKIFSILNNTEKSLKKNLGVEQKGPTDMEKARSKLHKVGKQLKNKYADSLAEKELQKRSKAYNEELKKGIGSGAANFGDYEKMAKEAKKAGRQTAEKNIQAGIKAAGLGAAGLGVAGAGMTANNYRKKKKEEAKIKEQQNNRLRRLSDNFRF